MGELKRVVKLTAKYNSWRNNTCWNCWKLRYRIDITRHNNVHSKCKKKADNNQINNLPMKKIRELMIIIMKWRISITRRPRRRCILTNWIMIWRNWRCCRRMRWKSGRLWLQIRSCRSKDSHCRDLIMVMGRIRIWLTAPSRPLCSDSWPSPTSARPRIIMDLRIWIGGAWSWPSMNRKRRSSEMPRRSMARLWSPR